jgi:hypothetical protein
MDDAAVRSRRAFKRSNRGGGNIHMSTWRLKKRSGEITDLIRDLVLRHPERAAKDLQATLLEAGHPVIFSSISATRTCFLGTLKYLARKGLYTAPGIDVYKGEE